MENLTSHGDLINHPTHYNQGNLECIQAMEEAFGVDAVAAFCKCNAFKYLWRADHKNGVEDLEKARWYLNKLLDISKYRFEE